MAASLYSPSWHRVAPLVPRLRANVEIHRHVFRGRVWYVVQDAHTGKFHRLSSVAHRLVCLMDGRRSCDEIWHEAGEMLGIDQPTQDEFIRLLAMLHSADLVLGGVTPHMEELDERARRHKRLDLMSRFRNPLSLRLRLVDPDRFLTRTVGWVRPLFGPFGLALWLALVGIGATLAAMHFGEMAAAVVDHAFTAQNAALLLTIYPILKLAHEMGHAYATKVWGGEVHELGVMVLVFMPVPYVDASASVAFREKHRRALVGAAGIMVEMAAAAIATIVWGLVEPGLVRAIALDVALIGGVSTLLFNGNPLLRFDGYYVLSDLLEIPNLAKRANDHVIHLVERRLFGIPDIEVDETTPGERRWFVAFALASFAYRMAVMAGIAFFVAGRFFFVGVILAVVLVAGAIAKPVASMALFLTTSPRLAGRRRRAFLTSGALALAAGFAVFVLPVAYSTVAVGVLWVDADDATVRAGADGMLAETFAHDGVAVAAGTVVARLEDPILAARAAVVERQTEEIQIRLDAVDLGDRAQANILREQLRHGQGQLEDLRRSLADLAVTTARPGRFLVADPTAAGGRFVQKGEVIGHIVDDGGLVVRTIVPQTEIDLVRARTAQVAVRLGTDGGTTWTGRIERIVPAAVGRLPHPALATTGGGPILIDTTAPDKLKPLEVVYEVDVRVPELPPRAWLGLRAAVRFEHPAEAIGFRVLRSLRQLFLRQLHV